MDKKLRDRLVGGLGAAGLGMVFYGIFIWFAVPAIKTTFLLWLTFEMIGIIL